MSRVWDRRHFEYREIDILDAKNAQWKSLYEFDIPVVRLAGDVISLNEANPSLGPHRSNYSVGLQQWRDNCSSSQVKAPTHGG